MKLLNLLDNIDGYYTESKFPAVFNAANLTSLCVLGSLGLAKGQGSGLPRIAIADLARVLSEAKKAEQKSKQQLNGRKWISEKEEVESC